MKELILRLRNDGKTYDEIKEVLGCSKGTIAYHCGEGQKLRYKESNDKRRKRNQEWIDEIKSKLFCKKCGENRFWLLDFHHINPEEKEHSVSHLLKSSSKEKVLKEIEKCLCLCSNCHRDLHYQEKHAGMAELG